MAIENRYRDNLSDAKITVTSEGSQPFEVVIPKIIGEQQWVSGTWEDSFQPGSFRANPVIMEKFERSDNHVSVSCTGNGRDPAQLVTGNIGCQRLPGKPGIGTISSITVNQALVKARGKLSNVQADLGLMSLEAARTLRMLVNPLSGLRNLAMKFLNETRRGVGKDVASIWLEYRYGFRPFMMDVEDIINAVEAPIRSKVGPRILSKVGLISTPQNTVRTANGWSLLASSPCRIYGEWVTEVTSCTKYRAHQYYRITGSRNSMWGTDGSNAPNLAWEILPYSFVVDWFVDVGGWLRAITPEAGIELLPVVVTRKHETTTTVYTLRYAWFDSIKGVWIYDTSQGSAITHSTYKSLTRVVYEDLAVIPPIGKLLDWRRALDAVGLVYQTIPTQFRVKRGFHAH